MAEPGVEQRLAAILAADVVGYTRLMADDEPATIATITEYRTVFRSHIEANGGRVVDMAGDSILAVFTSAAGAVKAAVEAQGEVAGRNQALPEARRMRFRVGVNLGDIREADDGTVYGDGVNIAARLEGLAAPGGVMISEDAHRQVRRNPDLRFADAGAYEVKNVAEPVRAYRVLAEGETAPKTRALRHVRSRVLGMAAGVLAITVVAGIILWPSNQPDEPEVVDSASDSADDVIVAMPTGPSIAVLPFDNLTGDPEQEYFADGVTEEIITGLTRFQDLFVIARSSTFQYKDRSADVREIGQELGVRYVVEGSIRRAASTIRITARLTDATNGAQLWVESYDRALTNENILTVQDDITDQIVGAIADSHGVIYRKGLLEAENRFTDNLESYECVLRAHQVHVEYIADKHLEARECLERTVRSDPDYAEAWA